MRGLDGVVVHGRVVACFCCRREGVCRRHGAALQRTLLSGVCRLVLQQARQADACSAARYLRRHRSPVLGLCTTRLRKIIALAACKTLAASQQSKQHCAQCCSISTAEVRLFHA